MILAVVTVSFTTRAITFQMIRTGGLRPGPVFEDNKRAVLLIQNPLPADSFT